ncbi:MAG TPA: hypothetical protein VFO19_22440 [Vicinamibacterales bacterium]|nr:hypothetical protein [Vicinamibacterales bacterium]
MNRPTLDPGLTASQRVLEALVQRLKDAYVAQPSLSLTPLQASRLCGIDSEVCEAMLNVLVATGFLRRGSDDRFLRAYVH